MSSATLRDAMEKVRDPAANSVADLKLHAQRTSDEMAKRSRDARSRMRGAMKSARKTAGRVGDEVSHGYDVARDYTVRGAEEAWSFMRSRPMVTLAIATGIGVLIGGLLLARPQRRKSNSWFS
jgi:ElaB/YqjD/DUF883 family membrane-anchored ribosome-binding protein